MKKNFALVALNLPIRKEFSYRIPEELQKDICVGSRVWVDFSKRRLIGFVVGFREKVNLKKIKDIAAIVDSSPLVDEKMMKLTRWISSRYICSWGKALEATVPVFLKRKGL